MPRCKPRRSSVITWHWSVLAVSLVLGGLSLASAAVVTVVPTAAPEIGEELRSALNLPLTLTSGEAGVEPALAMRLEAERLTEMVHGLGYLDGAVVLRQREGAAEVVVEPQLGPLYRIGWIDLSADEEGALAPFRKTLREIAIRWAGAVARGDILTDVEKSIIWLFQERAYPYAKVVGRSLLREADTRTVAVSLTVDLGPKVSFGAVQFEGSLRYGARELAPLVPFRAGERYRRSDVDALRNALEELDAFRRVGIRLADAPDAQGRVDLIVELRDKALDSNVLAAAGAGGRGVLLLTLALIVSRQLVVAGGLMGAAWRRPFDAGVALMLGVSSCVIVERIAYFLD